MTDENETPQDPPEDDPNQRLEACGKALDAVLREFNCRIEPAIQAVPVGDGRDRTLVEAVWGIVALPLPSP